MQDTAFGLLAGGAALGLVASMWGKIKGFAWRIAGLLVQRVEIPTEQGHEALVAHLVANYKRSAITTRCTARAGSTSATGATG